MLRIRLTKKWIAPRNKASTKMKEKTSGRIFDSSRSFFFYKDRLREDRIREIRK